MKRLMVLPLAVWAAFATASDSPAKADPAKGQTVAAGVCAGCHGPDGNSQIPTNPKLAAQGEAYIAKQLANFRASGDKPAERANPIMAGMAATLSEEDIRNVAAYYATQKINPDTAKSKDMLALGQRIWRAGDASKGLPACAGCHGPAGAGLPAQFPRLAGQFADYTEAQLKAFRDGVRGNDPNKMMRMIAVKMTDPEIKAVSDYAAGLR